MIGVHEVMFYMLSYVYLEMVEWLGKTERV